MERYTLAWAGYMAESGVGEWVRYEDAAAELAERDRRIAGLRDVLRYICAHSTDHMTCDLAGAALTDLLLFPEEDNQ